MARLIVWSDDLSRSAEVVADPETGEHRALCACRHGDAHHLIDLGREAYNLADAVEAVGIHLDHPTREGE